MTRTPQLKQINPIAARAEVRRTEWELEATQKAGFWRRKRFDFIDLVLFLVGTIGSGLLILGALH